jgi:uncharacterized iron-regulated protein
VLDRPALLAGLLLLAPSCARTAAEAEAAAPPAGRFDPAEHAYFDGEGRPSSLAGFASGVAGVDLVAFGELHYHPVGARAQLELLTAMAAQPRPVALAMELFEVDTQTAVDDYLGDRIDEAEFRARTRRDEHYDASHRPLIELCKRRGIPVLAANAPRRLVTAWRKSGSTDYAQWLGALSEEERGYLPRTTSPPETEFTRRFLQTMGKDRGARFLPGMALWNDAMAESAADYREAHPDSRVLLVVGGFHVAARLGVVTQYLARRPTDKVAVLSMRDDAEGPLGFGDGDRGEGDLVLKVRPAA